MRDDTWADLRRPDFANVWSTRPVEEQPELMLERWQVIEVAEERYFVGYAPANREGRVSSRIVTFDPQSRRGITQSGRVYQLVGEEGIDRDAQYVLGVWLRMYGYVWEDVKRIDITAL